jgi:circadian clock protein KaiB
MTGRVFSSHEFEQAAGKAQAAPVLLRLFVAGGTLHSMNAITRIRQICEEHLPGGWDLEVVDIYQQRSLARTEQIVATPTLIKYSPDPKRIWIGDLGDKKRILAGLGVA